MNLERTPLVATDGFQFYKKVVRRVFGPACPNGQIIKTGRNERIVKVERRVFIGDARRFEEMLRYKILRVQREEEEALGTGAAERRFKAPDGPRVLICTAAGREGINLQHARVLFNFDLPWNPMDLEQRIGRIHRYGQSDTAQIYNLVLSDTIEGSIFLLLTRSSRKLAGLSASWMSAVKLLKTSARKSSVSFRCN
jgi:hypothetical protein